MLRNIDGWRDKKLGNGGAQLVEPNLLIFWPKSKNLGGDILTFCHAEGLENLPCLSGFE